MNPFQSAMKWFLRIVFSFLVVTALLAAWNVIKSEFNAYHRAQSQLELLQAGRQELETVKHQQEIKVNQTLNELRHASADQILKQIQEIEAEIRQKESEQLTGYDKSMALLKGDITPFRIELELVMLKRMQDYLQLAHENLMGRQRKEFAAMRLEVLRREHQQAYDALMAKAREWEQFRSENYREIFGMPLSEPRVIPFTAEWEKMRKLEEAYKALYAANQAASEKYKRQEAFLKNIKVSPLEKFKLPEDTVNTIFLPVNEKMAQLDKAVTQTWASHFAGPVSAAIPVAILIIVMALLTPMAIKTFMYYVLAPLVARRRPICLMPEVSGEFSCDAGDIHSRTSGAVSAVSQAIHLDADHELLIHPEYLQSSSVSGKKDTKFLLDWAIPLTSLLAGLIALTRIRTTENASYVVSSTKDPLSEIAIIAIPEGSAVVVHPHSLVGMVQRCGDPVKITRRWQLNRLNAWLTLQIRYFIFHGPSTLIVKGCRGVRVEHAEAGRSINQAAMIGFSANLVYNPKRCETFISYLRGKQALFNDHFSGAAGYYIYEEMPHHGSKSSLLFGRGLEGVLDTFLKIFGI